jgi:signal transduction histidine kinase
MSSASASVLVVDVDALLADRLRAVLARDAIQVQHATVAALDSLPGSGIPGAPVVLLTARHPDLAAFVSRLRGATPLVQVLLLLDDLGDPQDALRLVRDLGVHGCYGRSESLATVASATLAALGTHEQLVQLHATERIKSELLADVSHEFRTPLNVILGYLDLFADGAFGTLPPEAIEVHQKLVRNASFLLDMAEEFLDVARVEATASPRRHDAIDLKPVLRDLADSFRLLVHERPLEFRTNVPADLPSAHGDPAKLRVIVQNLLANAAKFTREGFIELSADIEPNGWLAVRVTDSGPGIPEDQREKIFDLFHQAGSATDRAKGVGIGLALARRFAQALGGHVGVDSTVGVGTTFTLRLPAARRSAAA